jgi:hypothetical protein
MEYGKALTCDELANLYDKANTGGRPARTLSMDTVFDWAKKQTDKFYIYPKNGTIHLLETW